MLWNDKIRLNQATIKSSLINGRFNYLFKHSMGKKMIINVGAQGYNCGLFALALATSLTIKLEKHLAIHVPEFVKNIKAQDVQDTEAAYSSMEGITRQQQIAQDLRRALALAMENDLAYSLRRIEGFVALCLSSSAFEDDMEAFAESNVYNIKKIRDTVRNLLYSIPINQEEFIAVEEPKLNHNAISKLSLQLINLMQKDFKNEDMANLLAKKYTDENLHQLMKICILFNKAWANITSADGSETARQNIKAFAANWFLKQAKIIFQQVDEPKVQRFTLQELGRCQAWIGGDSDYFYNAEYIYTYLLVTDSWSEIYKNYIEHVQNQQVMLSADELNCLAQTWRVGLHISIDGQRKNFSQMSNEIEPDFYITIANRSGKHWEVLIDEKVCAYDETILACKEPDDSYQQFSATPMLLSAPSEILAPQVNTEINIAPSQIIRLKQDIATIKQSQLAALQQKKQEIQNKISENKSHLEAKIELPEERLHKQQQALKQEQELIQQETALKQEISGIETLLTESMQSIKVSEINETSDALPSLSTELDKFFSGQALRALHDDAEKEADHGKILLGASDLEIRLEREKKNESKWQAAIQGLEKQNRVLQITHDNKKSLIQQANADIKRELGLLKTAEDNRLEKLRCKDLHEKSLAAAKESLRKAKTELDIDLSQSGTIKIEVSTCAGPADRTNRAYIKINDKKLHFPGDGRGLLVAFIDSSNGRVVFNKCFDTYFSADNMTAAAQTINAYRMNSRLIAVISSADESTYGGGRGATESHSLVGKRGRYTYLVQNLEAVGSHEYSLLRWRHLWYFVNGPGIKGAPKEFRQVCSSHENALYRADTFYSDSPKEYITKAYQDKKSHLEAIEKKRDASLEQVKKDIRDIEGEITRHKQTIASKKKLITMTNTEIEALSASIDKNNKTIEPFKIKLARCKNMQEQLKRQLKGAITANESLPAAQDADAPLLSSITLEELQQRLKEKQLYLNEAQRALLQARRTKQQLVFPHGDLSCIPLITSVLNENLIMLQAILELACDPNKKDEYGWTALHCAVARAYLNNIEIAKQMIRTLLQFGARIDIFNNEANLPHQVAVTADMSSFVLNTALNTYARKGNLKQCQKALEYGADLITDVPIAEDPKNLDKQNKWVDKKRTPLAWAKASANKNEELIKLLSFYPNRQKNEKAKPAASPVFTR